MEDKEKKKVKNYPSLPSNYVTLAQLQERWLKEKERKQRDEEEEEERKRKLQLQKKLEEEEQKRKLGPRGLEGRSGINYEPGGRNRKPNCSRNSRAVEVSPAKPEQLEVVAVVVDTVNVSAEQEQKSEESKEEKKKKKKKRKKGIKPRAEEEEEEKEEVTDGMALAPHVITEKENALAKRNRESKGTRSEFRPIRDGEWKGMRSELKPRRKSGDRTAEIQRRVGDLLINSGIETVNVREEEKEEVTDGMAQAPGVITEKENAPAKRDGKSKGTRSEIRPKRDGESNVTTNEFRWRRKSGNRTAEIQRRVWDLSINSGIERVNVRVEEEEEKEVTEGMAQAQRLITEKENAPVKRDGESKGTRRKSEDLLINSGIERVNVREEEEEEKKEVTDSMAQAPRVITEKDNAPVKRDGESKGKRSKFRQRRESGDRTAEIQRRVWDLSINSGIERVNVRVEEEEEKEVTEGMAQAQRLITEKENAPVKRDGESKRTRRKSEDLLINSGIERVNVREEEEEEEKKEVMDSMAQAPRVITEKDNAPVKRDSESKGKRSKFRQRRESGDRTAEIQQRVGDLSINSGIERVNVRVARLNTGVNRGNREYRGHGRFGGRREVQQQTGVGMVWVRKGELPDDNAGGVQSSK
jgi:predicted nuclease of predicted toxin-antitoxin system